MSGKLERFHEEEMIIDQVIYQALEKGINIDSQVTEENKGDENVIKIQEEVARKKEMILTLFNGDFSENEQLVRRRHTKPSKVDIISAVSGKLLRKKIDEIFEEVLKSIPQGSYEATIGWERKYFLDSIVDENWEFDLDEIKNKDDEGR